MRGTRVLPALAVAGAVATAGAGLLHAQAQERAALRPGASLPHAWLPWALLVLLVLTGVGAWWQHERRSADHARDTARLDLLATLDGLTGTWNRRHIEALLRDAHKASGGEAWLSVLMVDVDHFKRINDTFGHAAGDTTLVSVVHRLTTSLRQGELIGRWGGEEFLVVLPHTDLDAARAVAERLRRAVAAEPVTVGSGGDEIDVTVSIGVAATLDRSPDLLVHIADRALYTAKAAGRDRVSG